MKILSIPNQKMQKMQKMQNSNTRPVAFGGFKSVVAGRSMREDNQLIALALRLTGRDLREWQGVLKDFSNPKLEGDMLHISVAGYNGNPDSPYGVMINHIDTDGNDKFTKKIIRKIQILLDRIGRARRMDIPENGSEEAEKMYKALMGDRTWEFNSDEICLSEDKIKSVTYELEELMPATGEETSFMYPDPFAE